MPWRFSAAWTLDADRSNGNSGVWTPTTTSPRSLYLACAVQRRRFPVGASPTRQPLQPEAIGAVMEVTKWLKPSISVSRIGASASVQAVTRVNAEKAAKRTMRRPTRQPFRGRLIRLGEQSEEHAQPLRRGSGDSMNKRKAYATREAPKRGQINDQPEAREGQAGRPGVAERFVVPLKPGNSGGGKGP